MNNKKNLNEKIWEMRKTELLKLSEIKRGLYDKGFWVPKKIQK